MRTSLDWLIVSAGASAIMAIGVLVAGVGLTASAARRTERDLRLPGSVGLTGLQAPAIMPDGVHVAGRGQLCSSGPGIQGTLSLYGLVEGQPYTAWLAYSRRLAPGVSQAGVVDGSDADVPETPLLQLGEGIAPESGELEFRGGFPEFQAADLTRVILFLADPDGSFGALAYVKFDLADGPREHVLQGCRPGIGS